MREWQGLKTAEMAAKDLRAKRAQRAAAQAERRERAAQREAQQAQQVQAMRRSGCSHCSAACAARMRLEICRSNGRHRPRVVTQSWHILSLMYTGPTRMFSLTLQPTSSQQLLCLALQFAPCSRPCSLVMPTSPVAG